MKLLLQLYKQTNQFDEMIDLLIECCLLHDYESEYELLQLLDNQYELTENQLLKYLEYLASLGNKEAMFELSKRYIYSSNKNLLKSERYLRELVKEQYPGSEIQLGLLLLMMEERIDSNEMIFTLFQQSALKNESNGMNNLGVCYALGCGCTQNIQLALQSFTNAIAKGNGIAENNKGIILFSNGKLKEAFECFQKSGENGSKEGMYNEAICYFNGDGIESNTTKAMRQLTKSASLGYSQAEYLLASCYLYGKGVIRNSETCKEWMFKSAEHGNSNAMFIIGGWYYLGDYCQMNKKLAVEWYTKSSEHGNGNAMCNLGRCYFGGDGIEMDKQKAAYWFKQAAEKDIIVAQYNIANCYYYGDGIEQSIKECMKWSKKASINGHSKSLVLYGKCLLELYQFEQAYQIFEEASSLQIEEAKWYISQMKYYGIGCERNEEVSLQYHYINREKPNQFGFETGENMKPFRCF